MKKLLKSKITLSLIALTFVVLSANVVVKHLHHEARHAAAEVFPVIRPWRKTLQFNKEYVAQIRASQHIELRSYEKGYLQQIFVDEGQLVHKGQPMFQLMPLLLEAEFKKTKAEYELTRIEYTNTEMLERKKVVSPAELALAKARLQKAKAEMDLAETHLQFSTVKAPFDGIMDRFHVRLGSLVEEGELLTFLSDNSSMWVYFNVSETDYLSYMEHKKNDKPMPAKLMLANGELFDNEGEINTIEADFNNETGNVSFRATFPNPKGLLRHGETGTVLLAQTLKNALIIPQKATFEVLDKKFVYVVDKDGMLRTREIKVAQEVPHLFAIRNGLQDDDTILLEGLGKVHAGIHVEVKYQTPQAVLASLKLPLD